MEDAAEALGASYHAQPLGSFGDAGVFSFNGNKIITTSGGGMLVTGSAEMAARARHLATQAREPFAHYEHNELGFNYRLSNLLAALGRAQLRTLPARIERRRQINATYRAELGELPGISFMPVAPYGQPNYWLTCILVDPGRFGADREDLRLALEADDIESRPLWKPLHLQPVFAGSPVVGGAVCAGIFERGLCLPSGSSLSGEDLARVDPDHPGHPGDRRLIAIPSRGPATGRPGRRQPGRSTRPSQRGLSAEPAQAPLDAPPGRSVAQVRDRTEPGPPVELGLEGRGAEGDPQQP